MSKSRNKKILMSEKQLEKMKMRTLRQTADMYQMITLWALHKYRGYGEKRLSCVLAEIDEVAQYIIDRRLTTEDIRQTLEKETGLKFILHE